MWKWSKPLFGGHNWQAKGLFPDLGSQFSGGQCALGIESGDQGGGVILHINTHSSPLNSLPGSTHFKVFWIASGFHVWRDLLCLLWNLLAERMKWKLSLSFDWLIVPETILKSSPRPQPPQTHCSTSVIIYMLSSHGHSGLFLGTVLLDTVCPVPTPTHWVFVSTFIIW